MTSDKEIAATLREARRRVGMSQQRASSRVGLRQTALSKIENGHQAATASQYLNLMAVYGDKVADVITRSSQGELERLRTEVMRTSKRLIAMLAVIDAELDRE